MKLSKVIVAIAAITILELFALWQGIDGTVLAGAIAAVAGLGGYSVALLKK